MAGGREFYASGNWLVKEGSEDEFMARWKDWLSWSSETVPGFGTATLLRDSANPRHFLSFADWDEASARDDWKQSPEFGQKFSACRELCDEFQGGDYSTVASF